MKKIKLLFTACFCSTAIMAQTDTLQKHAPYISIGMNYSPKCNNSFSAEAGTWGLSSNTSFGATYDFVSGNYLLNNGKTLSNYNAQWIGVKVYYTTHNENKLCYMVYFAPKHCINAYDGMNKELIEFGFNPYYTISKQILFGVCLSNQYMGYDSPWNIGLSGGFTFLFINKHK